MTTIPVDTRRIHNEHFRFNPSGPLRQVGERGNPREDLGKTTWSVRLFIGFNVGDQPTWSVDDIIGLVRVIREEQGEAPDATFYITKGMYTGNSGVVVTEDGCQVVIINSSGRARRAFEAQMTELAERLCGELQQEAIFGEIQKNGLSQGIWRVTP